VIGKPTIDGNTAAAVFAPSDKETEVLSTIAALEAKVQGLRRSTWNFAIVLSNGMVLLQFSSP